MNWTKEFPKEDGFYFCRRSMHHEIEVIEVYTAIDRIRRIGLTLQDDSCVTTRFIDAFLDAQYLGPITPEMFLIRELPIGAALLARPAMEDVGDDGIDATKTFIATADGIDDCISTNPFKAVEMLLQEIKKHDSNKSNP